MKDFLAALGLFFVIEGIVSAAMPDYLKQAMASVLATPNAVLRFVGIGAAAFGVFVVWLARG